MRVRTADCRKACRGRTSQLIRAGLKGAWFHWLLHPQAASPGMSLPGGEGLRSVFVQAQRAGGLFDRHLERSQKAPGSGLMPGCAAQ